MEKKMFDEVDWGVSWNLKRRTDNLILRWWGNLAGLLGSWFINQADLYGDYYELDDKMIGEKDV
jgi:hypothetical protein